MKNITLILSLLLLLVLGCEKQEIKSDLEDDWELITIQGGSDGSGWEANFDQLNIENKNYVILRDGLSVEDGTYNLNKVEDNRYSNWRIRFESNFKDEDQPHFLHEGFIIFQSRDTLFLDDGLVDGYYWIFKRGK